MRFGGFDRVFKRGGAPFHDFVGERGIGVLDLAKNGGTRLLVDLGAKLGRRVGQPVDRLAQNCAQIRH